MDDERTKIAAAWLVELVQEFRKGEPVEVTYGDGRTVLATTPDRRDIAISREINSLLNWHKKPYAQLFAAFADQIEKKAISARQAKVGKAAHAETTAMKVEVFQWLDSQPKFKSKEQAARAITKQQPIAHRTAYKWVGDWEKLRSAGRGCA